MTRGRTMPEGAAHPEVSRGDRPWEGGAEPIAIVGMACRLPGGVRSPAEYWSLLLEGRDAIREVPADRWEVDALYSSEPAAPGRVSTRWGGFLDDVGAFDAAFFHISPREAEQMDPQQRLALTLSWEALEDAHILPAKLSGQACGVYVGAMWSDYARLQNDDPEGFTLHTATGQDTSIIAGRISYALGLEGPSLVVNTASSSSLVAIHLACGALRSGEAAVALAGGVNLLLSPLSTLAMSKLGTQAPDGRCKAFDAQANGYVRGEGGGMVVLKPLSRALLDGDPIYCLIRGGAVNNDGFSNGLTAPSPRAQERMLREAYRRAGVRADQVQYVETHGPGTRVGDPIEAGALGAVLGAGRDPGQRLLLGSVKTNLGHLEAAAGVAGLMKTALALKHRFIPRNLHFHSPNPVIPFEQLHLEVAAEARPWPRGDAPPLAGVSSFGFGGTNCHLVLEGLSEPLARIVPLSANSPRELEQRAGALLRRAAGAGGAEGLHALARAAIGEVGSGAFRDAFVVRTAEELRVRLRDPLRRSTSSEGGGRPRLAFICQGSGAPWAGMGRTLLRTEPVFRASLEECERLFRQRAGGSVLEALVAGPTRPEVGGAEVSQALLFALQVALAALWRSWGIQPDVLIGPGLGELVAAHLGGAVSLEDAVREIARGHAVARAGMDLFAQAVQRLAQERETCFLELGPSSVLSEAVRAHLGSGVDEARVLASLRTGEDEYESLLETAAALFRRGLEPNWPVLMRSLGEREALVEREEEGPLQLALSASSAQALRNLAARYERWLEGRPSRQWVEDVSYTAAARRTLHAHRLAVVATSPRELGERLAAFGCSEQVAGLAAGRVPGSGPPRVVFVFPGHGGQHLRMGRELLETEPVFREAVEACDVAVARHARWSLLEVLASEEEATFDRMDLMQPTLFALGVGLAALWRSWGVAPSVVLGHSMGEIAAAHVAGALSLEEAARIMVLRSELMRRASGKGAMLAVEMDEEEARRWLEPYAGRLSVALLNSPRSTVLSGEPAAIDELAGRLAEQKLFARRVRVDIAAHGPQMAPLARELTEALEGLRPRPATVDICSTVLGGLVEGEALDAAYWGRNLREPVQFSRCLQSLVAGGPCVFIEMGPHPVLQVAMDSMMGEGPARSSAVFSTRRDRSERLALRESLATVYASGVAVDWSALHGPGRRMVALPPYGWDEHRHWLRPRPPRGPRGDSIGDSPLPARRTDAPEVLVQRWERAGPAGAAGGPVGRWLLLSEGSALAGAVRQRLEAAGGEVLEWHVLREGTLSAEEVATWLSRAFGSQGARGGVLYLGPGPSARGPEESEDGLFAEQRRHHGNVLALLKALKASGWRTLPRLLLVMRGTQLVEPGDRLSLGQTPLWGLARVLGYEHPELGCRVLDLPGELSPPEVEESAAALVREVLSPRAEEEVALRGERRYVGRLRTERLRLHREGEGTGLRPDASYLLTGGLGRLGLAVAQGLVEGGARHLALVGRSDASPPRVQRALEALRATGAEVRVFRADVAERSALQAVLARMEDAMPPLGGVVHLADVAEEGPLAQDSVERFARLQRPKVMGAWNLHLLTQGRPLDFLVLFSSAASLVGAPGRASAAAAEAFVDALAHYRRAQGMPGLSLDWGPFSEVDEASGATAPGARLAARGLRGVSVAEGVRTLLGLLGSSAAQLGMASLDARQWVEFHPSVANSSRLSVLRAQAAQGTPGPAEEGSGLRGTLAQAGSGERPGLLESYVREQVAQVLRLAAEAVDRRANLKDLGFDSLLGMELRNRLERAVGLQLSSTLVWSYPTVADLAGHLLERLELASVNPEADAAPPVPAPSSPASPAPERSEEILSGLGEEAIAIIGMGCRLPGGANDLDGFWRLLVEERDGIRELSPARWPADSMPEEQGARWAGLLDEVETFDASFFGISRGEATALDPQQRLLLELTWEALETAGIPPDSLGGTRTGVFVGLYNHDYEQSTARQPDKLSAYALTGTYNAFAAGRISYLLGLQGPCMTVDTVCSSSLVAVHLACRSLRQGESDLAMASGVNLILSPLMTHMLARMEVLASDGRCKTFDARADGMVRGEGGGVVVLKRLRDALRDGDRVWAVVRGSAVNQDGRSTGLTAPNGLAQQAMLRQALEDGRVRPSDIGYLETHGTGTPLGDPIEVEAIREVVGRPRADGSSCVLGAVKTNIGHLEAAAGIAGLIKVVLALEHQLIPRNLNLQALNPRIQLEGSALRLASEPVAWTRGDRPRLAGVSSFGMSGTNAHVVLSEPPALPPRRPLAPSRAGVLLTLSARTPEALAQLARRYVGFLRSEGGRGASLEELAYTAGARRSHHEHRLALAGRGHEELAGALEAHLAGEPGSRVATGRAADPRPRTVFVFGPGPVEPERVRALLEAEPAFREAFMRCDSALRGQQGGSLMELLAPGAAEEGLSVLLAAGALYCQGVTLDWSRLRPAGGQVLPLPTYPWQRKRLWAHSRSDSVKP